MGVPKIDLGPMTVEDFFAFTDSRPDDERWELIDGEPVLNATPSFLHQEIAGNVLARLRSLALEQPRTWPPILGIGVRVSDTTLPVPDVLVRPANSAEQSMSRECDDMIVGFRGPFSIDIRPGSSLETDAAYSVFAVTRPLCRYRSGWAGGRCLRP